MSRGHDRLRELLGEVYDALAEIPLDYWESRDLGDRIVGIGRIRKRGEQTGAVTEMVFGTVTDTKNGRAIRISTYLEPLEEAAEEVQKEGEEASALSR